mmetsp:Transcript_7841/g.20877  ORF Transcript_7841/g.20877 Transcript_7841/m.20877 type:complete len:252 (+) Transcript_7841:3588-4343(+)
MPWVQCLLRVGHHEGAARRHHAKYIVDGEVEGKRREAKHLVVLADAPAFVDVEARVARASVRYHDALRPAGGTARVDDVRQVRHGGVAPKRLIRVGGRVALHADRARRRRQRRQRRAPVVKHDERPDVLNYDRHAFSRLMHRERHVGAAGEESRENTHHLRPALIHDERHRPPRAVGGLDDSPRVGARELHQRLEVELCSAGTVDDGGTPRCTQCGALYAAVQEFDPFQELPLRLALVKRIALARLRFRHQ